MFKKSNILAKILFNERGEVGETEGTKEKINKTIDPEEIANSVKGKLSEEFDDKFKQFTENFAAKMDTSSNKEEENADLEEEEDDETEIVTKADLKVFAKDLKKTVRKEANDLLIETSNKHSRDLLALETFPMLNAKSKLYNQEFKEAVMKEWDRREKAGIDPNSPDIMYDSAAAVFASNPKWHKQTNESIEDDYQKEQNKYSNFQSSNRTGSDKKVLTKQQSEIAKKFGMDSKRSEELRKKYKY